VSGSLTPIGGNPPIASALQQPAPWNADGVWWLSSGRDAYLLAARLLSGRRWLLPDLLCPVVINTLRIAGATCVPYRPGRLAETLQASDVVVLAWDPQGGPSSEDLSASADHPAIIEDRCLWAGLPHQVDAERAGRWVIGSCRKWLGGIAGGWLRGPASDDDADAWRILSATRAETLQPLSSAHSLAVHAAGALRRLRLMGADDPDLEQANLRCSDSSEALDIPFAPCPQLRIDRALVAALGDATGERERRTSVARSIQTLLGAAPTAVPGVSGIRVHTSERDACLAALREVAIFAPVHWRDGDWSTSAAAARLAQQTLTLPCPAGAPDDYLRRLEPIIRRFAVRAQEPWS
jgi:hypothetical protein